MTPAITFPNMRGDVTVTWDANDPEQREYVTRMVEQKMKEGYRFFILVPRKVFGVTLPRVRTKVTAKNLSKLESVGSVTLDESVKPLAAKSDFNLPGAKSVAVDAGGIGVTVDVDDKELSVGLSHRKLSLARLENARDLKTVRLARDAADVVDKQSAAVRAVVGG